MLSDARKLDPANDIVADVCIVGGGAAGLILAHELGHTGIDTVLLESGDLKPTRAASRLITARAVTDPGFELSGGRRRLGGGFADWGANCSLLESEELKTTAEPGSAAWPVALSGLNDYAVRAAEYLSGFEGFATHGLLETARRHPLGACDNLVVSDNTPQFSDKLYLRGATSAASQLIRRLAAPGCSVRTFVNATVLTLDIRHGKVEHVEFTGKEDRPVKLQARTFILAGGTENAPILMRSLGRNTAEARARLPALGRLLHTHLLSLHGFVIPGERSDFLHRYMLPVARDGIGESPKPWFCGLHAPTRQDAGGARLATAMFFEPVLHASKLMSREAIRRAGTWRAVPAWKHAAFTPLAGTILKSVVRPTMYAVRHFMEQPARWDCEVSMGPPAGRLGLPQPEFAWHIGDLEKHSMRANCSELSTFLAALGAGQLVDGERPGEAGMADFGRNVHPMGGTIIGQSIKDSVVDASLKVHGIANLYICGGSTIPRSGTAMITGIIAQLAIRLGYHLKQSRRSR